MPGRKILNVCVKLLENSLNQVLVIADFMKKLTLINKNGIIKIKKGKKIWKIII
jgi:hypothetical protein